MNPTDDRTTADPNGTSRTWAFGAAAVLGVAGVAMAWFALRPPASDLDATDPGAGPTPVAAPAGEPAAPTPQAGARFPTAYDSLAVSLGSPDAPVVVREFIDYQCPACGAFAPVARRLRETYVESGDVRFVVYDFPITEAHPHALAAAQAARCADRQGRYWPMHDGLFDRQPTWSSAENPLPVFVAIARESGLDAAALRTCVESGTTLSEVRASAAFATRIGVRSTPTVLVDDRPLTGLASYDELRARVDARLAGEGP